MSLIVINPSGIKIYEKPSISANIITQEPSAYTFSRYFNVQDSEWYEVTTPEYTGYIRECDIDYIDDHKSALLTEVELKYLIHLLKYAKEELFIYSTIFLKPFGVEIEETDDFIENLIRRLNVNE